MFTAAGHTADKKPLLIVGISGENMTRLMAQEPIRLDLAQHGLPDTVLVLIGGRTEQAMHERLVALGWLPPTT